MMHRIRLWFRNYFGFTQVEIQGFLAMSVILILLLSFTFISKFFYTKHNYTQEIAEKDRLELQKWVAQINEQQKLYNEQNPKPTYQNNYQNNYQTNYQNNETHTKDYPKQTNSDKTIPSTLFAFNPNTASKEDLQKLGIPKFIAQRIVNYREKGGQFKIKTDLKKMYGLPEQTYIALENYIQLPDNLIDNKNTTSKQNEVSPPKYVAKQPVAFDINLADTAQLKSIRGIGTVLAERIIKFRNTLGGFHSVEQLTEIYGLQPEVITELSKYIILNKNISKININTADEAKLKTHPYIGYKIAAVLVAYRKQHGNFKTAEDLLQIKVIDAPKLEKMKPYIEF